MRSLASEYVQAFTKMVQQLDVAAIERVVARITAARVHGATIYVAGNGGSASTASHWVNDLGKATKISGLPPIRVMSLNDNVSWLTALGNDEGYERVFSGQLENFARSGDVLLVISASGNSPNLVRAVEMARERGVETVAFLGFDGGLLRGLVDDHVLIESDKGAYGLVESVHSLIGHVLTSCIVRAGVSGAAAERQSSRAARWERPRQAVILAGGRGTRLGDLTSTRPKPMIEIHGRPFLEYQIEQLRDQGITRILLLLGYLPEVIQDYFGDGSRWGVDISYSVSSPDDLTVRRVQLVRSRLDPCFLLLYCDNYYPMQMDKMWARFVEAGRPAMITVYRNRDGYSRDSVRIGRDGIVEVFDRSRTTPGLSGIEISYAIVTDEALEYLPEQDALFEEAVYTPLAATRQLAAFVTDHRYYSVGSQERLPKTETFFARRPTVFLDRDGVLNERPPRAQYIRSPAEFHWLPGSKEALRLFNDAGYRVVIVSNQAGIGRGVMTARDLELLHEWMRTEVRLAGGRIDAIYHCPHDWNAGCECRKPRPGMLFQAQRDFDLDLTRTLFIGDDERDKEAAEAAGCPSALVSDHVSLLDLTRNVLTESLEDGYARC